MQLNDRILGLGRQFWCRLAASLLSLGSVVRDGRGLLPAWQNMKGWEAYWTAQALVTGHGYSFPSDDPWPFDPIGNGFHSSAWTDPLYTFTLAGLIRLFGSHHRLAAAILNLGLLLAVFGFTYRLAERLVSPTAGVGAVLILALNRAFSWTAWTMNNTILAAAFVAASALMLVRFLEGPSARRAGALGLVLGLTMLACPGAQLFIPVAAVAVIAVGWSHRGSAVAHAGILLIVAASIVSPWVIRNYMAFGEYVPGRTGLGHNVFFGVIVPAAMVMPEKLPAKVSPPWRSETARSSVREVIRSPEKLDMLYRFESDYTRTVGPAGYASLNEAQRDNWLLQQSKAFVLANPAISAQLAVAKIEAFVRIMGTFGAFVCLLAAIGGILAFRTPAVLTLALWVGSFAGPFLLMVPFYERYRAPIEPLLVILAVFALRQLLTIGLRRSAVEL
jgi:4-amino-4-deoxy-L-arabinose transferase-like glycosyltransferase